MEYNYKTKGVCSRNIRIKVDGDIVESVEFTGGCNGNSKGVAALVKNCRIDEVIDRLMGIKCGGKSTSCPEQLAIALREIKEENSLSK